MPISARARAALRAAHIARRDAALHPLVVQLERAATIHFAKQALALKGRLLDHGSWLNERRLQEGIAEDIEPILDDLFLEFSPQFIRDLTRISREGKRVALKHCELDWGYQLSFALSNPAAEAYLQDYCTAEVTRIDNTSRRILRTEIIKGQKANLSYKDIAKNIIARAEEFAAPASGPGVTTRAERIAVHELAVAYETATHEAGEILAAKGVPMQHEWSHTGDGKVCPICTENAAAGPIPLDQPFPSGHSHAPAHVGCRCSELVEMDESAADRILGPREIPKPKPTRKPRAKPDAPEKPEPTPKKLSPAEQIRADFGATRKQVDAVVADSIPLQRRLDEILAEKRSVARESAALRGKGDNASLNRRAKLLVRWRELVEEHLDVEADIKRQRALAKPIIDALVFRAKNPSGGWAPQVSDALAKVRAKTIDPAARWLEKAVFEIDTDLGPKPSRVWAVAERGRVPGTPIVRPITEDPIRRSNNTTRAYCRGQEIFLPKSGASVSTVVHESGHYIDSSSTLRATNAVAFRNYRTQGEPTVRLCDLFPKSGYELDEVTKVDKFKSPYCGKDYGTGQHSEITSMGLQWLYEDALKFLEEDPEYFEFMLYQLRGVKWNPPKAGGTSS